MADLQIPAPRGNRRLLYISDPSSIASRYLPDPASEESLRNWIDDVAAAGVDTFNQEVYTQAWTTYWRIDKFDYDARPQHRRFLPLLDAGIQPLAILIDQAHKRGMEFIAGFRMNDNHAHVSIQQGVGGGGSFIVNNPQWQVQQMPPGDFYRLGSPLDFSFKEVRDFLLTVMTEVAQRFDVEGLEMCFRDHYYFPYRAGRERQPVMTELVQRIRGMLDEVGKQKGKKLLLGAHVFSTVAECQDLGLDVPTWIGAGLIDYICPADVMYADFNAPYQEFAALTRASNCMLYPSILPWSSWRSRKRLNQVPMTQDNRRALSQNFYGAGADGVSVYNHFEIMHASGGAHAPFYPMAMHDFHELRHPERILQGQRHYIFDPTWGEFTGFGPDRASTGAVKAQKIVLQRGVPHDQGEYIFRLNEDLSQAQTAMLLFRGYHMTKADQVAVQINGTAIPAKAIKSRCDEVRLDVRTPHEPPFCTHWFTLTAPPAVFGENRLTVQLLNSDPAAQEDIVIDEVEVFVIPRP